MFAPAPSMLFLAVLSVALAVAWAEDEPAPAPPVDEVVALYLKADAILLELDEQHPEVFTIFPPRQLGDAERAVIAGTEPVMALLREGLSHERCRLPEIARIGEDFELLITPRRFMRTAQLRAFAAFADGEVNRGIDDLVTAMAVARQVADDGYLIHLLVDLSVEQNIIEYLAMELVAFDDAALDHFAEAMRRLRPLPAIRRVLDREARYTNLILRQLGEADATFVDAMLSSPGADGPTVRECLRMARHDPQAWQRLMREAQPLLRAWWDAQTLPLDTMEKRLVALQEHGTRSTNPIERWITGNGEMILASHRARVVAATRWRMLEAGIALRRHGRDAFNAIADPHGRGPFTLTEHADGSFELRSQLRQRSLDDDDTEEAVSLHFGPMKDHGTDDPQGE